jgi:hypothetical protein
LDFYDRYISRKSPSRTKLSVHLIHTGDLSQDSTEHDHIEDNTKPIFIKDEVEWRKRLTVDQEAKPVKPLKEFQTPAK